MTDLDSNPDDIREPLPAPDVDPAEQLAHLIPALWRTISRASTSSKDLPATEAQVTILRMVILEGGLAPAQLADILHLARPTVSNLLKGLIRDGLVERLTRPHDARQVVIVPTQKGYDILSSFRQERTQALRAALDQLDLDEEHLVKTLRRVLGGLERIVDEGPAKLDPTDGPQHGTDLSGGENQDHEQTKNRAQPRAGSIGRL